MQKDIKDIKYFTENDLLENSTLDLLVQGQSAQAKRVNYSFYYFSHLKLFLHLFNFMYLISF